MSTHRRSKGPAVPRWTGLLAIVAATVTTVGTIGSGVAAPHTPVASPLPPTPPSTSDVSSQPAPPSLPELDETFPTPAAAHVDAAVVTVPVAEVSETPEIPVRALAAYQRAATVMAQASPDCGLEWTLLAATAAALTAHGTEPGDHEIAEDGTLTPPLLGTRLRAANGEPVPDTDGGELDGDPEGDRGLGPFLLSPARWNHVGVDAAGDGVRDPQNVDDAALAAAVLVCADGPDLTDRGDVAAALGKFASGPAFVETVLEIEASYAAEPPVATPPPALGNVLARAMTGGDAAIHHEPPADTPAPAADQQDDGGRHDDARPGKQEPKAPPSKHPEIRPTVPPKSPEPTDSPEPTETPAPTESPTATPTDSPSATPTDSPAVIPTEESTATERPVSPSPTASPKSETSQPAVGAELAVVPLLFLFLGLLHRLRDGAPRHRSR